MPACRVRATALETISYLLLSALVLASLSYWLPWIDHHSAALKLSGQDLGEFVKFVPRLQHHSLGKLRHLLYLPPFAGALCLTLLAVDRKVPYPWYVRVGVLVLALFVLTGLLPPVWGRPRDLFAAEYRIQSVAALLGASVVLVHGLFVRVRLASFARITAVLAAVAVLPTQSIFWMTWPRIRVAYGTPTIHLGWGLALHVISWLGVLALSIALCLVREQPCLPLVPRGEPEGG